MSLAVILGRFLGAVLAECAPILSEIVADGFRKAFTPTVEDGARRPDLRAALLASLHANRVGSTGRTGETAKEDSRRGNLGAGLEGDGSSGDS